MTTNLMNLKNIYLSSLGLSRFGIGRNRNIFSGINRTWGIVGLVALGVGALAYPGYRLFKYIMSKRQQPAEDNGTVKSFGPAYRGHHKPHRRKVESDGHLGHGLS